MVPYQAVAPAVTTGETQTTSTVASDDGHPPSSREHPYGDDDPFPVHQTTEQVAYSLHPAIFVPEYGMPMGCGRGIHEGSFRLYPGPVSVPRIVQGAMRMRGWWRIRLTFPAFARV